jgi:y4mF family transcriptional regulator
LSGGQNRDNITEREKGALMLLTPEELGRIVKKERKALGLTQADLALTSGTGMRFISDLENGKPTCQIGKTLTVLKTLGLRLALSSPNSPGGG